MIKTQQGGEAQWRLLLLKHTYLCWLGLSRCSRPCHNSFVALKPTDVHWLLAVLIYFVDYSSSVVCVATGPSFSSSTVTDILSVPPSLDTSLSAPPGDPTLTPPEHSPSKSRFFDSRPKLKSSLKPPLMPRMLASDEPLTPPGLRSPTTPHFPRMGSETPQSSVPPFQTGEGVSLDVGVKGIAQVGSCTPQTARSHLTSDLAAAMQQEEDRRASNAKAESSSSPTRTCTFNDSSSRQAELHSSPIGNSNSRAAHQQKATPALSTPFQLASQKLLDEQGPPSPPQPPSLLEGAVSSTAGEHSLLASGKASEAQCNGTAAYPASLSQNGDRHGPAGKVELSQHDGQGMGSARGVDEDRLLHTLQALKGCVSLHIRAFCSSKALSNRLFDSHCCYLQCCSWSAKHKEVWCSYWLLQLCCAGCSALQLLLCLTSPLRS